MNERIRELAEHANYLATEKEFPYDVDWFYLYNKKFAELIIRECAMLAYDGNLKRAIAHGGSHSDILKHFGVEE